MAGLDALICLRRCSGLIENKSTQKFEFVKNHAKTRVIKPYSRFVFGDTIVEYLLAPNGGKMGLRIYPKLSSGKVISHRKYLDHDSSLSALPNRGRRIIAWDVDSLIQVKLRGYPEPTGFTQGRTMHRGSPHLQFRNQKVSRKPSGIQISTTLADKSGCYAVHQLTWERNTSFLKIHTLIENRGKKTFQLDAATSFSLGGISPFHRDDAPESLFIHRFRSYWSAEGRHERISAEHLHLERSWCGAPGFSERFGQVGSLPVRGFFPFIAAEDAKNKVFWGAHLACPASWQMEIYRQDDCLSLAGGLADKEFGHWSKIIQKGEKLSLPIAVIATSSQSFEDVCDRLLKFQECEEFKPHKSEKLLPIICNEYATTWGNPTSERILCLARRAAEAKCAYFVIDAGWYRKDRATWWNSHGDWMPNKSLFPGGLKKTCEAIRNLGMAPGIWFEFETCGEAATAFSLTRHMLKRDRHLITAGVRRFWDFCDPWVRNYLQKRVIDFLRDNDFGYLKIDCNETLGIGCDGRESLGEGLRRQMNAVQDFIRALRSALPDIVIENCAGGGHRLEPSMMALADMASFSDAISARENPIIAANLHRLVLPRKTQIWCVVNPDCNQRQLIYSLASGFLGRMCLSGNMDKLNKKQWQTVLNAGNLYRKATSIISNGYSRRVGSALLSFRHPRGWQGVSMMNAGKNEMLIVLHRFFKKSEDISLALPSGAAWRISDYLYDAGDCVELKSNKLHWHSRHNFSAAVILAQRVKESLRRK